MHAEDADSAARRRHLRAGAATLGVTDSGIRTELRNGRWTTAAPGLFLTRPGHPTSGASWALAGLKAAGAIGGAQRDRDAAARPGTSVRRSPAHQAIRSLVRRGGDRRIGPVLVRRSTRQLAGCTRPRSATTSLPGSWSPRRREPWRTRRCRAGHSDRVRELVTGVIQRGLCTSADLRDEVARMPAATGSALLAARAARRRARRAFGGTRPEAVQDVDRASMLRRSQTQRGAGATPTGRPDRGRGPSSGVALRYIRARSTVATHHFSERDWKATMAAATPALTRLGYAVEHHAPSVVRAGGQRWAEGIVQALAARARELGLPPA